MNDLQELFEKNRINGLFEDYDFCVRGEVNESFSGGTHVSQGAYLFDVASLTKACNHLLFWKLFYYGELSPDQLFRDFILVPEGNGRQLWHFLCYLVKDYNFSYEALRKGISGHFRDVLLQSGFGPWGKRFLYDNISSSYLGLILEKIFSTDLETVFQEQLLKNPTYQSERFLFHPLQKNLFGSDAIVPTHKDQTLRGIVHDPLSFAHPNEKIAVAGLFTDADMLVDVFQRVLDPIIESSFYDDASKNQLSKLKIEGNSYGLGFDIPYSQSLGGISVDSPLVFGGYTGCRIFFAKKPRVTVSFLTNRVYCGGDDLVSRQNFSKFSWEVIRQVLKRAKKGE